MFIVRIETKQRRQTVTPKGGKLDSTSCVRVTFMGYVSSFVETVVDIGFKAV